MSKKEEFNIGESLFKDRTILINKTIEDDMAGDIISRLIYLNNKSPSKDIELIISSNGGSVSAGLSIIDVMDLIECDVKTTVVGNAFSMAFILAMCGTKGKRATTKHSQFMAHDISTFVVGKLGDLAIEIEQTKHLSDILKSLIEERSNLEKDAIDEVFSKNSYYNAQAAVDNGFVDKII